ncbi:MAG TPA: acylneuraminate cytidylyltransferase family protein [Candidatus Methylacidiphilales bacterium]|nr:acylneuraminate cytidylyltransferase family protein [Candidatus Methylacidiphilales bacterium]
MSTSIKKSTRRTFAFIFARGGSKGIPRKNLQDLGGLPLIAHAIRCGQALSDVEKVILSTDDEEIAETARQYGAEVPFLRPAELAGDKAPERLAWQHAVTQSRQLYGDFDVFLSLPVTAPLRSVEDVQRVLAEFQPGVTDVIITVSPGRRSPYFNMVTQDADGWARLICDSTGITRRQDAPEVFDMTTVAYAASPDFVMTETPMMKGRIRMVVVPSERALDIDEPVDLDIARFLYDRSRARSA